MKSTLFLGSISASFRQNFLKLHTKHSMCIPCKLHMLNCSRLIMNGTLLVEEYTFTAISLLTLHAFCQQTMSVWLQSANNEGHFTCRRKCYHGNVSPPNTPRILPSKDGSSSRPIRKDTSFAEHSTTTAVSPRPFQGFSLNATCNTLLALPTNGVSLLAVGQ